MNRMITKITVCITFLCAVFPLFSQDTSTVVINKDAVIVNSTYANNNYGSNSLFAAHYYASGTTYREMFEADFSSIPTNAIIIQATLKLHVGSIDNGTSHPFYIERSSASWVENTVTWNNQPGVYTSDQISIPHASVSSGTLHSMDVTSHVQYMVNYPSLNYGWRLRLQSESGGTANGVDYRSSDYSSGAYAPEIEVTYVLPIEISGNVQHCTNGNGDGAITGINIAEGSGTYASYEWFSISSGTFTSIESGTNFANIEVSLLDPGLYLLDVVDDEGTSNYKYFAVGEEGETTTVQMYASDATKSSKYWKDATVQNQTGYEDINYGSYAYTLAQYNPFTPQELKTYIDFQIGFDYLMDVQTSELVLTHPTWHYRGTPYSNEVYIKRITESWQEDVITYNTEPSVASDIIASIPQTAAGYGYTDYTVNLIDFVDYWQANPGSNFGIQFALANPLASTGQWMRQIYGASDNTTAAYRPKFELSFDVKNPVDTIFVDSTMLGAITINAPNGELPYTYLLSRDSIPDMDSLWWYGDSLGLDSTSFYQGKLDYQQFTFSDLKSGRYFIGVFDNNGEIIFDKDIYLGPGYRFVDTTTIIISGDTILVDTVNFDQGRAKSLYPILPDKSSGMEVKVVQLDEDVFFGFNDYFDPPIVYDSDFEFAIEIESSGDVNFIKSGVVRASTTCSVGDFILLAKEGDRVQFKLNGELIAEETITEMPQRGYQTEFKLKGPVAKIIAKPFQALNLTGYPEVTQPLCGSTLGQIEIAPPTYHIFNATSYLLYDEDGVLVDAGSVPTTVTNLSPGYYTLTTNWTLLGPQTEQVLVGFPVKWKDVSNTVVQSSTLNSVDIEIDNGVPGEAKSINVAGSELTTEVWVQTELNHQGNGGVIFTLTDGTIEYFSVHQVNFGAGRLVICYSEGTPIPFYGSIWNAPPGNPTPYNNFLGYANIVDDKPLKLKWTWDGDIFLEHNGTYLAEASPSFGTSQIHLETTLYNDQKVENTLANFCYPLAANEVKLRRSLDGGYYNTLDGLLKVEYDEEYNDNVLVFNVYDNTYDPQNPSESEVDMMIAPIRYGDNRLAFDFACPGTDCLTSGYYILEVINDKDEKLYLRFKI